MVVNNSVTSTQAGDGSSKKPVEKSAAGTKPADSKSADNTSAGEQTAEKKPQRAAAQAAAAGGGTPEKAADAAKPQRKKNPARERLAVVEKEVDALRKRAETAEGKVHELNRKLAEPVAPPVAQPAQIKQRHWGVLTTFLFVVIAPLIAIGVYLFTIAEDQYISTAGFTVRSQEGASATDLLGGIAQFTGASGTGSDSDILYEFIRSQEIAEEVNEELGVVNHYAAHWPRDWAFALWPEATSEDLTWFWQRIVSVSYDSASELFEIQATAYDRDMAQAITRAIVQHSQDRINALNEQAREDAMRYARADLDEAVERLKLAREALIQFRTRTRIVDPEADIQGRMGVMNNLQQQLAEALVEYDLLRGSVNADDPRLGNSLRRIQVIRERIDQERTNFASSNIVENDGIGESYPALISEYERLTVDREFAEETYRVALTSMELARDEASRQNRYLATYINPTRAEDSEYPRRYLVLSLAGLFLLMLWAVMVLIYYSVRDRR